VVPEAVMKATSHWLELKGHTPKSHSTIFDEIFSEQVIETGKIEDGHTIKLFFKRTGQALAQPWMVEMVKRLLKNLPIGMLTRMGLANIIKPKTSGWAGARDAIKDYVAEQEEHHRKALGLDELVRMAETELKAGAAE
jgi:heterodisulfide reductase subunit C